MNKDRALFLEQQIVLTLENERKYREFADVQIAKNDFSVFAHTTAFDYAIKEMQKYQATGADVIDEIPSAYKDLDIVMANQTDLIEVVHTLKAVMCIKGN